MELRKGMLFIFRPFHMHSIKIDMQKENYIRSLFVFEPARVQQYLQPFSKLQSFFHGLITDPFSETVFTEIPEDKFNFLVEEFRKQLEESIPSEALEVEALFMVSFMSLLRNCISSRPQSHILQSSSKTSDSIRLALDWLEKHYIEEFQLNKLADEVHLSPNHLSYLFHKETGSCISDYLAVRRIQEACRLLITTSLSTEEVGRKIGLNNFSYFCKFFKKYIGLTPYNFRKLQNANTIS